MSFLGELAQQIEDRTRAHVQRRSFPRQVSNFGLEPHDRGNTVTCDCTSAIQTKFLQLFCFQLLLLLSYLRLRRFSIVAMYR